MPETVTPMMKQYHEAKKACPDALLLFRMGDFYEMFHDDAKVAAQTLGITLTSRDKGENATPMAGFPHHQLESYLGKLIAAGMRVAVCDQVEDPKEAKGLVRREITRIVTRGTVTDEALLDPRESNFLAAVCPGEAVGLAWVELSTGRFVAAGVSPKGLADQLARVAPAECLLSEEMDALPEGFGENVMITRRPAWAFAQAAAEETLAKHFGKADFPLGRKRYTKLSYLLHRHAERQAEGYLKKAAGPYNPKTRYGGPERIALENGYVREHKNGPYSGFVAADSIAQAEGYFEKWYGPEVLQWLEQFRFKKNDELELLATVDMAAEELRGAGKAVNAASVKVVVGSHPEWQAKLDRPVFSDAGIAQAIEMSRELFAATGQDNIPGGT